MRGAFPGTYNLHFATVSRDRPTESCERARPAINENLRLATAACNHKSANVQFAAAARAKMYEICVSLQFRAIDPPDPARRFIQLNENLRLIKHHKLPKRS